jgi:hypothetical protein
MNTATGSKPFRLDATDLQKIGNSAMLAIAGVAVGALVLLNERMADHSPDSLMAVLVATITPTAINILRKWASDNRKQVLPPVDLDAPAEDPAFDPALVEFVVKTLQQGRQQELTDRAASTARSDLPATP